MCHSHSLISNLNGRTESQNFINVHFCNLHIITVSVCKITIHRWFFSTNSHLYGQLLRLGV